LLIGLITASVAEAGPPLAALAEVTMPVLLLTVAVVFTRTVTVQLAPAGTVAPLRLKDEPLATAVAVPPQEFVSVGVLLFVMPLG
jgi:hypothetical protein